MNQIYNPYLPLYEYVPDGEPHVFGDRVYIYGSHDIAGGDKYCIDHYVTWSAPVDNLKDWRYEGVIYRRTQDPSNANDQLQLWAPDVTQGPDGRYYLYYCFSFLPEIGVAVSDSPAGPFEFYGHVKYPEHILGGKVLNEHFPFDPAVLTDDDGRVYLYYGFSIKKGMFLPKAEDVTDPEMLEKLKSLKLSNGSMAVELESDMLTVKEDPHMIVPGRNHSENTGFEDHAFFEASSIRKVNNTYYFVYSSELSHELCYATSDQPINGYKFGGTIVSNGDIGLNGRQTPIYTLGNNHGGMVKAGNDWYIFYHRQTNGTEFSRQGCAEKIEILSDGSIKQVEITSCGLNADPLAASGTYPSAIACHLVSPDTMSEINYNDPVMKSQAMITETSTGASKQEHEQYIQNIVGNTVIGYKYFDFKGVNSIQVLLRGKADAAVTISLDDAGKSVIGKQDISLNADEWTAIDIPVTVENTIAALYFTFTGNVGIEFKEFTFQ